MALPKLFQRIFWHNNTTPALNEDNLNAMSKGLSDVDDRVIELGSTVMEIGPKIAKAEEYALDSEAWAVGTRDGVPVSSDDETYENNAKWYSQHLQTDIGNLNDVNIVNPSDGDALVYNSTTQKWENGAADMGLFVQDGILMCRYETA